ncbi:MAG: exodeoxyribonuclease VII small subunit [Maricaulaceae bacterium]
MTEEAAPAVETLNFETALAELETIVERLEKGDAALEESIALYERGAALKQACESQLKAARMKVEQIVLNAQGEAETQPVALD